MQASSLGDFRITGTYLNAAYTHPMPLDTEAAIRGFLEHRVDPAAIASAPSRDSKTLFARLINASPGEIALIPSTSYGESFVAGAVGLKSGHRTKVVTDILHFDGGLYMYGELAKSGGVDLTVLPMTSAGQIDMNALEAAVDETTRLVAISLVSMVNGFQHDLKTVCEIAHRKGAYVYVDAVQAAGAVPIDVRASGVDFLACSTFKWLMGDFGCGYLYVRSDLLPKLQRVEYGYHQPKSLAYHAFPGDPPGDRLFEAQPNNATAEGFFEVGSVAFAAEAGMMVSLKNILAMGVDNIQARRQPFMNKLSAALTGYGYKPMTPPGSTSPIITFVFREPDRLLESRLKEAQINIQLYENRFRISPSIYNTELDIDKVIAVLTP